MNSFLYNLICQRTFGTAPAISRDYAVYYQHCPSLMGIFSTTDITYPLTVSPLKFTPE